MIREKFNLRCSAGHHHYSPNPDAFVGQTCYKPFANQLTLAGDIHRGVPKCLEKLRKLK